MVVLVFVPVPSDEDLNLNNDGPFFEVAAEMLGFVPEEDLNLNKDGPSFEVFAEMVGFVVGDLNGCGRSVIIVASLSSEPRSSS